MSNPLDNTSTADIRAELDTIVENLSEWMYRAAVLLVELRARKEHHPLMNSTTLRYFKQIAAGTLDPAMVLAVGGNKNIVRPLAKLPVKEQLGYAKDRPVQVVERSDDGGDVVREKPVMQLSPAALEQVFGEDGIRSANEQRSVMKAAKERKRFGGIIADISASRLVVGNKHVAPRDLIEPMKALGYEVRRIA